MNAENPKKQRNRTGPAGKKEKSMDYTYRTQSVCASQIDFHLEGNIVTNVRFSGGCNGNLKAVSKLVDGMTVEKIEAILRGNTCGYKTTSCADQLAIAVRKAYEESKRA